MRTKELLRRLRAHFDPSQFDWFDNQANLGYLMLDILGDPNISNQMTGLNHLMIYLDYLIPLEEPLSKEGILESIKSGRYKDPNQVSLYLDTLVQDLENSSKIDGLLQLTT